MSSNNIIVKEYLSSLKEDGELDHLFPLLLSVMGYKIIQTAKEAKGQSQYGKDIVAVGTGKDGIKYKWYFELKGYADKDITASNFAKPDGIHESIIEALYTPFLDSSIPGFNALPIKIVIVHNGILQPNARPTFEGFISKTFNNRDESFERWDISELTDLFGQYLFGEYLLSDDESNRLFKKTLALLDAPSYDLSDFKRLIEIQINKLTEIKKGRAFNKFFASLNLLSSIIFQYSQDNNNLHSAKECSAYLTLRIWAWILSNKLETKQSVQDAFRKLLHTQYGVLKAYFDKTLPIALIEDGLFSEIGGPYEAIGYPLRCFNYVNDLIYYYQLTQYYPDFKTRCDNYLEIINQQKDELITIIENNSGFKRPIIDNHSIAILNVFIFFAERQSLRQKDVEFIRSFVFNIINGLIIIKLTRGRLPEGFNRIKLVCEFDANRTKPDGYEDKSSILLAVLLDLLVILNNETMYAKIVTHFKDVDLQIPIPNTSDFDDFEERFFNGNLQEEYYIEQYNTPPKEFEEFVKIVKEKDYDHIALRTDKAGFPFLKNLAHVYHKNEWFPFDWRQYMHK